MKATILQLVLTALSITGCAHHSITITPDKSIPLEKSQLIKKNVAYVITEDNRKKEIVTSGGGGDKIKYYPYRDLEKPLRDMLKSIYQDVFVASKINDPAVFEKGNISFIFSPELLTTSSSSSYINWPPNEFTIEAYLNITDPLGNALTKQKIIATGTAKDEEFIEGDFALAGKRAVTDLIIKLQKEIKSNQNLK